MRQNKTKFYISHLERLVRDHGKNHAIAFLIMEGLSPSTADKLARGTYQREVPSDLVLKAIERACAKGEKAHARQITRIAR